MKFLFCLAALFVLMSAVFAHGGIRVGIPLPFIKIRFVDIANLFGGHGDGGHGIGLHGGIGLGHGGFGLDIGGGHHGHGW